MPTPSPADIPQPVPGGIGLAGDPRPDIARFLNVRSVSSASLAPDGCRLAYLTNTTGQPQLWLTSVEPGAPAQLTFGESSVTFQEWSPGGEWIAYGTDRGGDEREGFYLISPSGHEERELLAPSEDFRVWGGWSDDGARVAWAATGRTPDDFDIYVMDVTPDGTASAPRRALEGRGGMYVASWRPDGGALVVTETRGPADNDVHLLELATGELTTLFAPDDPALYEGFAWTPDGRGFYLVTNEGRDLAGLAHYDLASRTLRWVDGGSDPERGEAGGEADGVALSHDGRWLAWTVNENGYSALRVLDLRTGRALAPRPALPPGVYDIGWAPRAPLLAVRVAGPNVAGDVWTFAPYTARTTRATHSATGGLDPRRFVVPEAVSFPSWDGEVIHGLLYLPGGDAGRGTRDAGGTGAEHISSPPDAQHPPSRIPRPPVLLALHGGPTAQARPTYSATFQYLLARGVAVLDLNFRGSTGYGKRFVRLDDGRLRPNAVRDMGGALDWLAGTGRVDAARAAAMGGSYGGYMTFAALTQLPDRFRAGVGIVGVSNWVTALEGASPQLKAGDRAEYGDVEDPGDRAFLVELSPITHVRRIRAPLMVIHGANDPRDPVDEADQLVRAIREEVGGAVEYLRFPDEGHGIRKLANRITAYRRVAAFLERELGLRE